MHILILVGCYILMLVGLAGCVLPMLPGTPLVFAGIYIYAWLTGFTIVSRNLIIIFLILTVISVVIEYISSSIGSKKFGASKLGFFGAFVGAIIGVFFVPWGLIIGPLAGALLGELIVGKKIKEAFRSGTGAVIGFFGGTFLKIVISFAMIAFFTIRLLQH
jgi:uncharacterized protein YqgC (DUF456 family)